MAKPPRGKSSRLRSNERESFPLPAQRVGKMARWDQISCLFVKALQIDAIVSRAPVSTGILSAALWRRSPGMSMMIQAIKRVHIRLFGHSFNHEGGANGRIPIAWPYCPGRDL